jgi:long-chain fatty acid transport protein
MGDLVKKDFSIIHVPYRFCIGSGLCIRSERNRSCSLAQNLLPFPVWVFSVRKIRFAILLLLLLCWTRKDSFFAQELMFSGVGPINHSLAGVAAALPRDSAGAIYWNPATISFLEHSEIQLGWGRHNPPWYGDEPIGYTALIGLWLICESLLDDHDEPVQHWQATAQGDEYWTSYDDPAIPSPKYPRGAIPKIRVPEFSYVYNKGQYWSFGLAVSEYGANKTGTFCDINHGIVGVYQYQFRGYEFIPALSYRPDKHFSMGVAPVISIDEMPNASLPVILAKNSSSQDQRGKAGVGLQVGAFYMPLERLRFGVSVRTPQWIDRFTYRWINPNTDVAGTQQLSFSQDSPLRVTVGTSYTLKNEQTTFAADFRYSDYSHASALYDIPASFDSAVSKLGTSRGVYSLALGAERRFGNRLEKGVTLRAGYQWNHAVSPNKAVIYNTGLPIQSGHSIHYGLSIPFSDCFVLSLSVSNAFGCGRETLQTEYGTVCYRRNPNRNNFWIAGRLLF